MEIKKIFNLMEEKIQRYNKNFNKEFLPTSALFLLRSYNNKNQEDLEVWAFICATIDYQINVRNRLIPMMKALINHINSLNLYYIDLIYDPEEAFEVLNRFQWGENNVGFRHRFIKIKDLLVINEKLKSIIEKYDSIGKYIEFLYDIGLDEDPKFPMRYVLKKFTERLRKNLPPEFCSSAIPDFNKQSAMKRLCLYFRWMVRPFPDFEKWNYFLPKHLLPPVDSSIKRAFQRIFKISLPKSNNFEVVIEIYKILQQINKEDPIKYDFALSRPAIAGYCAKDPNKNQCYLCPFIEICESAHELPEDILTSKPLFSKNEQELFTRFLQLKNNEFDEIKTEVNLGRKRVDALCHVKKNGWWVIEVEDKLNYTSVGQALVYKRLYEEQFKGQKGIPVIVCGKDDADIARACELDVGIKVFIV